MSYILEALRRADAERERERGQVPGLHTQPAPGGTPAEHAGGPRWPLLGAGAALGLLLAALAWWLWPAPATPPEATTAETPRATAAPAPRPLDAPVAMRPPPLVVPPAPAVVETPRAAASAAPAAAEERAARPAERRAATAAAASASAAPVVAYADLPDAVKRELPPLAIGGSVYSDDPATRFVMINGNVFRENDTLAPRLVLEQIRPKSAVLRYRDIRYEIRF